MFSVTRPIVFLSLFLLLLQPTISSDILAPLFSPIVDELCKDAKICGKGKCKVSVNQNLGYMCECDQGWKQSPSKQDLDGLRFLPCVVPNCTVDYACTNASAPSPQIKDPPKNTSFFDPCNWAYCGEGSCKKSSTLGHECECPEGSANLLNATAFPCFNKCSLGMDCAGLGLTLSNNSVSPPPTALTDRNANHASTLLPGKILWMVFLMSSIAMSPWK